jgi:hypothetical protein
MECCRSQFEDASVTVETQEGQNLPHYSSPPSLIMAELNKF